MGWERNKLKRREGDKGIRETGDWERGLFLCEGNGRRKDNRN
jgi:hypothetical protein